MSEKFKTIVTRKKKKKSYLIDILIQVACLIVNKSKKGLPLETKAAQNHKFRSDMTESLHMQHSSLKLQGVPQSQAAALSRYREEEETDKTKQAQIKQTYEMR